MDKPAEVVKLVDTQRSGRCALKGVGGRVPPSAPYPLKSGYKGATVPITLPPRQGYGSILARQLYHLSFGLLLFPSEFFQSNMPCGQRFRNANSSCVLATWDIRSKIRERRAMWKTLLVLWIRRKRHRWSLSYEHIY